VQRPARIHTFSLKPLTLPRGPSHPEQRAKGGRKKKVRHAKGGWVGGWVRGEGEIPDGVMTGHVVVLLHKQSKL